MFEFAIGDFFTSYSLHLSLSFGGKRTFAAGGLLLVILYFFCWVGFVFCWVSYFLFFLSYCSFYGWFVIDYWFLALFSFFSFFRCFYECYSSSRAIKRVGKTSSNGSTSQIIAII